MPDDGAAVLRNEGEIGHVVFGGTDVLDQLRLEVAAVERGPHHGGNGIEVLGALGPDGGRRHSLSRASCSARRRTAVSLPVRPAKRICVYSMASSSPSG